MHAPTHTHTPDTHTRTCAHTHTHITTEALVCYRLFASNDCCSTGRTKRRTRHAALLLLFKPLCKKTGLPGLQKGTLLWPCAAQICAPAPNTRCTVINHWVGPDKLYEQQTLPQRAMQSCESSPCTWTPKAGWVRCLEAQSNSASPCST